MFYALKFWNVRVPVRVCMWIKWNKTILEEIKAEKNKSTNRQCIRITVVPWRKQTKRENRIQQSQIVCSEAYSVVVAHSGRVKKGRNKLFAGKIYVVMPLSLSSSSECWIFWTQSIDKYTVSESESRRIFPSNLGEVLAWTKVIFFRHFFSVFVQSGIPAPVFSNFVNGAVARIMCKNDSANWLIDPYAKNGLCNAFGRKWS